MHPSQRLPPWQDLAPLQPLLDAAQIVGLFEWNIADDVIFPSHSMVRIFGLDQATIQSGAPAAAFAVALHPEDRAAFPVRPGCGRDATQTVYRVVGREGGAPRTILQSVRFAHGPADWACGVMFDYPAIGSVSPPLAGQRVLGAIERAAGLAIELRRIVQDVGSPTLRTLVDLLLAELGEALAQELDRPEPARLN